MARLVGLMCVYVCVCVWGGGLLMFQLEGFTLAIIILFQVGRSKDIAESGMTFVYRSSASSHNNY